MLNVCYVLFYFVFVRAILIIPSIYINQYVHWSWTVDDPIFSLDWCVKSHFYSPLLDNTDLTKD